ncbi:MAG: hypothetical protein ACK4E9_09950 [Aeromonas media]
MKCSINGLPVHGQILPKNHSDIPATQGKGRMKRKSQVIRAQFKQVFNLTLALKHASNTDGKCMPYFNFVILLYPLVEKIRELDVICSPTHWAKLTRRMCSYSLLLLELLKGNQTKVHPRMLGALLGPLMTELEMVKEVYTRLDSNRKAAQATNSKPKADNQKNEECELTESLPTQEPPIRDGLVFTTPQEKILELIVASLTGKQDDIWTKYQACLPSDLTPDEVKTANDTFKVMLKEHFI